MSEAVLQKGGRLARQRDAWWEQRLHTRAHPLLKAAVVPRTLLGLAFLMAVIASTFSVIHGWNILYNDAQTHLNIARRVTDGLTPGLAQLGSVWLPLPQLLMAPFTAISFLWHSGIAGALVNGAAFIYASARIYSLTEELTAKKWAGWCAFIIFATNLNILYLQSTSLDETIFLACFIGAVYHLARWTRNNSYAELAWAGLATFLGTLTRYDGWSLFVASAVVVVVWTKLRERRAAATQANFTLYSFVGGYGIVLWLLYNWIIFGSPWYFINSTYSAQTQQLYQEQIGLLPTKYHLATTLVTFGWGILDVASIAVVAAGVVGVLVLIARRARLRHIAILTLLAAPILMNIVMLFIGQTTMRVPQMPLQQIFNLRYALEALPLLAVGAGSLAAYLKGWGALLPLGAAAAAVVTMVIANPITLSEGQYGVSAYASNQATASAAYLTAHYQGGEILADDGQASPLIFRTGFNLKAFVTPGFHPYWDIALVKPVEEARWIVVYQRDAVDSDMLAHPARFADYQVVFTDSPITIYELKPGIQTAALAPFVTQLPTTQSVTSQTTPTTVSPTTTPKLPTTTTGKPHPALVTKSVAASRLTHPASTSSTTPLKVETKAQKQAVAERRHRKWMRHLRWESRQHWLRYEANHHLR